MSFSAIEFYLQRVSYHIDTLFIYFLFQNWLLLFSTVPLQYNPLVEGCSVLITCFSTFQKLFYETSFLSVLRPLCQWLISRKKSDFGRRGKPWLIVPVSCMNTLRKISNSLVNGNSAHIADGYEWKHREDHVHTLNMFTGGRLPRLKFHVYATLVPRIGRTCYY